MYIMDFTCAEKEIGEISAQKYTGELILSAASSVFLSVR